MRCWVFNEEQLLAALRAFSERRCVEAGELHATTEVVAISQFLTSSPEAREHKLIMPEKR
jgi:hypothetical protein